MEKTPITLALVEDNRNFREGLAHGLNIIGGFNIVCKAPNGAVFLQWLREQKAPPQAVIIDIDMPVLDGLATVLAAKELASDTEFVMLTVFDDEQKIFEAVKAGACGYLLKDAPVQDIAIAIQEAVELGGCPMSPSIARKAMRLLQSMPNPQTSSPQEDYRLSDRETEVLEALVKGESYTQIAEKLHLSPYTIRKHTSNVYTKLHVSNKTGAVKLAVKKRWFLSF